MKPSKFITVRGRKAWFLPSYFSALTWKGYAYCKRQSDADKINSTDKIDSLLESHETIHIRQAEAMHDSWFCFYLRYVWEWICNLPLIFTNLYAPYKFMEIELEAYLNQNNWDYCMHGATYQWKEFERLKLKQKRAYAKEWYSNKQSYGNNFSRFIKERILKDIANKCYEITPKSSSSCDGGSVKFIATEKDCNSK
jgi:hypothetical protein